MSIPSIPSIPRILGRAWPPPRWPSRWQSAAGVVLVLLLTVIGCYVEANPAHSYGGLHLASHPPLAAYLLVALAALALAGRDRAPVAVFAVTIAAAVAWAALGQIDGAALVPVMVALFWVALTRSRQVALAAGLAGAAAIFLAEGTLGPFGWLGGPNATMWPQLLAAGALGAYVAARRKWLAAERDRAAQAELTREEETRRRVDAERMRIARELHDVVAHSMAMINVQATAAGVLLAEDPAGAADAIQAIRGASKSGLRELRAILQVLRDADPACPPADAQPARHPDPRRRDHRRGLARHRAGRRPGRAAAAAGRAGRLPHRAGVADQRRAPRPRRVRDRDRGPGRRRADHRDN